MRAEHIRTPFSEVLLEKFRTWIAIRNQEMEYYYYATLRSRPLFEEIGRKLDISVQEAWNSSQEMIVKAIEKNDRRFILRLPHKNLVIYNAYGKTRMASNVKPIATSSEEDIEGLRGKKVYGEGELEAVVKIAFTPQELENYRPSSVAEVLVTGMTTPDFIPYLKKNFAALITDEGGILCHAAIVAREIALPCIVGTGIATEVLKSGARVRINLDTATIKMLIANC